MPDINEDNLRRQKEIGLRIRALQNDANLSQEQLAQKVNMDRAVLSRIENGTRPVRDTELIAFSQTLNVSTDYILGNNEKSFKSPDWATEGDRIDLDKMLQSNIQMGFGGMDWNKADKVKIRRVLESLFWDQLKELRENGKK